MPINELLARKSAAHGTAKSDRELVEGCLKHREEDWNLLVDKHKNLVFSIPIRYGFSREEAADIFQSVCLDLIRELPKLRDPQALPKWLMQVAVHKCFQWKKLRGRTVSQDDEDVNVPEVATPPEAYEHLREVEAEQMLRNSLAELPPRCRELLHMLFFEDPKRPYQ